MFSFEHYYNLSIMSLMTSGNISDLYELWKETQDISVDGTDDEYDSDDMNDEGFSENSD